MTDMPGIDEAFDTVQELVRSASVVRVIRLNLEKRSLETYLAETVPMIRHLWTASQPRTASNWLVFWQRSPDWKLVLQQILPGLTAQSAFD